MTHYEFFEAAWNDIWDSFNEKKKEFILSVKGLKEILYCEVITILSSVIAGNFKMDPNRIVDIIKIETSIMIKKEIIENILRRLYYEV